MAKRTKSMLPAKPQGSKKWGGGAPVGKAARVGVPTAGPRWGVKATSGQKDGMQPKSGAGNIYRKGPMKKGMHYGAHSNLHGRGLFH